MNYREIISTLKQKQYKPIYFLMGDEPYFIDLITQYITDNILTEAEKSFNQLILYGKDTDTPSIINTAKRFPMMASHQVVIVKEAQHLRDIDNLQYYAEKPLQSTILVINYKYKKLDKRKKLYKLINDQGIVFASDKLYEDKVAPWITAYLQQKNLKINPKAAALLVEFLGNDLGRLVNELEKLILTLPKNVDAIDSEHIEKNIGISKDYNNFELQKALIDKDVLKANRIVNYFTKNSKDNPFVVTITVLFSFFSKLLLLHNAKDKSRTGLASMLKVHPYFIPDYQKASKIYSPSRVISIISWLREYDVKSKGLGNVSTPHGELLKEMIYKILH
jgi:DNA polymerase-3 subunit delta